MVGGALELYADYVTNYNKMQDATVWCTSDNSKYQVEIEKLFDVMQIEEKIFDWAWTIGTYGDLFVKLNAAPGVGVVSIEDDDHPINISRVDTNGVLVGFYRTPMSGVTAAEEKLAPPWMFSHFRVLGVKRRRPIYGDPLMSEFRTIHILAPDKRRVTSKYGNSLISNALVLYKRLRLTEDSLLLARITRGLHRYIYKIAVDPDTTNIEAVNVLVEKYASILKKARAFDTRSNSPYYDEKWNPMTALEDIFIPVFGETNNVDVMEIGGKPDIKWIADVEELRNQLACALRCPLSLLGGYVQEASGALGAEAIEKLDIRFARNARRLQRALIEGITRIVQIHLAYMGMDPSLDLFTIHMSETSTAEEEALRETLDTSIDVIDRMFDLVDKAVGEGGDKEVDKVELLNFLNQKFVKLGDFDINDFLKKREEEGVPVEGEEAAGLAGPRRGKIEGEEKFPQYEVPLEEEPSPEEVEAAPAPEHIIIRNYDLKALTPIKENIEKWKEQWGNCMVSITDGGSNDEKKEDAA
jgi:hypothetical protein